MKKYNPEQVNRLKRRLERKPLLKRKAKSINKASRKELITLIEKLVWLGEMVYEWREAGNNSPAFVCYLQDAEKILEAELKSKGRRK